MLELFIFCDDCQVFPDSLRDDNSVKRVAVMKIQLGIFKDMFKRYRLDKMALTPHLNFYLKPELEVTRKKVA